MVVPGGRNLPGADKDSSIRSSSLRPAWSCRAGAACRELTRTHRSGAPRCVGPGDPRRAGTCRYLARRGGTYRWQNVHHVVAGRILRALRRVRAYSPSPPRTLSDDNIGNRLPAHRAADASDVVLAVGAGLPGPRRDSFLRSFPAALPPGPDAGQLWRVLVAPRMASRPHCGRDTGAGDRAIPALDGVSTAAPRLAPCAGLSVS